MRNAPRLAKIDCATLIKTPLVSIKLKIYYHTEKYISSV